MTYRETEYIINTVVGQTIFINSLGETEYHPERVEPLKRYFYLKYVEEYQFEKEYSFDFDMMTLEFYEELKPILDAVKINPQYIGMWSEISSSINSKIEFEKQKFFKRDNYSLTDSYLAGLLDKITTWIDDKGIDKLMTVLSKTGDEIGSKDV